MLNNSFLGKMCVGIMVWVITGGKVVKRSGPNKKWHEKITAKIQDDQEVSQHYIVQSIKCIPC